MSLTLEQCASEEEYYYSKWLDKLIEEGYVESYEYQVPIQVIDKAEIDCAGSIFKLNDMNYTADFKVYWTEKALNIFCISVHGLLDKQFKAKDSKRLHYAVKLTLDNVETEQRTVKYWSLIDIKGKFAGKNNNSAITFPLIQKTIYAIHSLYVQKIVPFAPLGLFNYTFTPTEYSKTKTGKVRKTNFTVRTLDEYIASLQPKTKDK